jgi:hypothetical protein
MSCFQSPLTTRSDWGGGVTGWRMSNGGVSVDPPPVAATKLLSTGPAGGLYTDGSAPFTVTMDGAATNVSVIPAKSGGAGYFVPSSAVISTGETASFVFYPGDIATYSITFSNSGGLANPVALPFVSTDPGPISSPLASSWYGDSSPGKAFKTAYATIPAGPNAGQNDNYRASFEKCVDAGTTEVNLFPASASGPSGPAAVPFAGYDALSIVTSPTDSTRKAFKFRFERVAMQWDNAHPTLGIQSRGRSEITFTGDYRYTGWDKDEWNIIGIYLPDHWRTSSNTRGGSYSIIYQYHDPTTGLSGNPPFAISFIGAGAGGNPANCKLSISIRKIRASTWPNTNTSKKQATDGKTYTLQGSAAKPLTGQWVYLGFKVRSGCGVPDYPNFVSLANPGAPSNIYGPITPATRKAYITGYVAYGENPIMEPLFDHQDFWGAPHAIAAGQLKVPVPTQAVKIAQNFYIKCGLYAQLDFAGTIGGGDVLREVYNMGVVQLRDADLPANTTPQDILNYYRSPARVGVAAVGPTTADAVWYIPQSSSNKLGVAGLPVMTDRYMATGISSNPNAYNDATAYTLPTDNGGAAGGVSLVAVDDNTNRYINGQMSMVGMTAGQQRIIAMEAQHQQAGVLSYFWQFGANGSTESMYALAVNSSNNVQFNARGLGASSINSTAMTRQSGSGYAAFNNQGRYLLITSIKTVTTTTVDVEVRMVHPTLGTAIWTATGVNVSFGGDPATNPGINAGKTAAEHGGLMLAARMRSISVSSGLPEQHFGIGSGHIAKLDTFQVRKYADYNAARIDSAIAASVSNNAGWWLP